MLCLFLTYIFFNNGQNCGNFYPDLFETKDHFVNITMSKIIIFLSVSVHLLIFNFKF